MGYFSETAISEKREINEAEPNRLEKLESRLSYLEDKLSCLESGKTAGTGSDDFFWDAVPLYDYDEPDSVFGLRIAIRNIREKIEAEYDRNMQMLEWRLSVLLRGETPEGQLAFADVFSFSGNAA